MIDSLILIGLLIWNILALLVDDHRRSKTGPTELSTVGKIAVLPITAGYKTMGSAGRGLEPCPVQGRGGQ